MDRNYLLKILILLAFLTIYGTHSAAVAKVYIDIDAPGFQQFPIAICDFQNKNTGASAPSGFNAVIADDVKNYLDMTGIFKILDKKSFLEGVEPGYPEKIRFPEWTAIGADFLVRGDLTVQGKDTVAESRLYDVARGQMLFNKRYSNSSGDTKSIALAIARDILMALTGDAGDFDTKIAFIIKRKSGSDIYSMNYDASGMSSLTGHQSIVTSPRWSPDGQYLAFTSYKKGRPQVYLRNLKSGSERTVASFEGLNLCGSFSPDSKKLLLTLSKDGNEDIYVLNIHTMQLKRLTRSYSIDVSPAWSPDGQKIAFVSNRSGSPQIFVMDANGGGARRITFHGKYNTSPSWSPRGGKIAYEGLVGGRYQIFTVDESGGNLMQMTFDNADNEYPSWSPSGRQIVFSSRQGGRSRICIMNSNGMKTRVLIENANHLVMPSWSPLLK
ncbi:MAG: Tol-Pal system beta propeller repeat protein TolB [Smithellaceae bacterium]|nr:Tol-Pal system beta propeller repeat protein TolB [Smithellaceae bacterium]